MGKPVALEQEFKYFLDNKDELIKKYNKRYVVIKDSKVLGSYPTIEEAVKDSIKKHEIGTFLVKQCVPGSDQQTFHSRVIFNDSPSIY